MRRERLAAFVAVLTACCSLFGRGVCQQPTSSDCITTVTLSVAGQVVTDVVPLGVVCFNCSIQGMVATNVMYTVGGDDIPMDEGTVEAGILVIFDTDVTFDPTNFITVRCANDDGFSQTAVLVIVFRPPIITGVTTINEEDTLDLRCDTSNSHLQPQPQWFNEDGMLLTSSSRLQIDDIDRSEAGMYTCRTNTQNPDDSTNTTVTVVVQFAPDVEAGTDELVLVPIMIGTLSLTCTYSGIPPASAITWLHNGTDLDPSDPEITVDFTATASTLTVTSLEETGGGMYECRPENVVGSNGATTQVRIQLPPDAATNLRIIPDSATIESLGISWTNPAFTGFSEINEFRLFITPDGFNRTFAGTAAMMDYTIESLSPFTVYTIELFVMTEAGLEGAGATTTGMTLSLGLGPVRELEAEALNSTAIRVTWTEPMIVSDTTAPVQRYMISYQSLREGAVNTGQETTQPDVTDITLTNLLMGTLYEILVFGVNTAGDGEESSEQESTDIDPPSVPQAFESKVLDPFSISVSWEEPETDGGRPVVRYNLTITGATNDVKLSASERGHTFTGLKQDTSYTISIIAVNEDPDTGDERSSLAVELVNTTLPVGPPMTPPKPQTSLVTNVSVRISWTDPGGYPDNYTLEIKLRVEDWTSPDVIRLPGLTSLSHDQDELVPLSRYEARVLSVNFNGPSNFSELAVFNTVGMISVGGGADAVNNTLETTTGETVTLTCTLDQLDQLDQLDEEDEDEEETVNYTWTRRDGRPLPDGSQLAGGKLIITGARTEDSGVYVCSANGVEGVFSLSVMETPSGTDNEVSTIIIIVVTVVGSVALIIFLAVVVLAVYCVCYHGEKKGESPHRRTYSFRPKHWEDGNKSRSMPREEANRKELAQSFHMPDEYTGTTSFNTTNRVKRSPSPPSNSKNSHAGAEPTTSFQLQNDNTVL